MWNVECGIENIILYCLKLPTRVPGGGEKGKPGAIAI
jgi:hypothetical protein